MWKERLPSGNTRYSERYIDPLTNKTRRVSITIHPTGKKRRDERTAREALQQKITAREAQAGIADKLTFCELVRRRVAWQEKHQKPQTARTSRMALRAITRLIGPDVLVCRLTAAVVSERLASDSPTTYNERIKRFKACMRWGYRADLVTDISWLDKLQREKEPPVREKDKHKYLEHDEIVRLLSGMKVEKRRLLTEFLILSGLRIGEAIALDDADVDTDAMEIHVTKTYSRPIKKTSSTKTATSCRVVYMQEELLDCCRRIKAYIRREKMRFGYRSKIFIPDVNTRSYISYEGYANYFRENAERILGRRLSPHSLRHTHTAMMAEAGVPLETISRRLGHADSKITRDVYMHVTEKMKDREREAIRNVRIID